MVSDQKAKRSSQPVRGGSAPPSSSTRAWEQRRSDRAITGWELERDFEIIREVERGVSAGKASRLMTMSELGAIYG